MKEIMRQILWVVGLAVVGVVGYLVFTADRRTAGDNPFAYDIQALKAVDAAVVTHVETGSIPLPGPALRALAVDAHDAIYVGAGNTIVKLDSAGRELRRADVDGEVTCLAVASDGDLYAGLRNRVARLDSDLTFQEAWGDLGPDALFTSMAAGDEHVFVADAGNRVAYVFSRDGKLLERIGRKDTRKQSPGLIVPSPFLDLFLDLNGSLWVVNPGYHSFEHYTNDGYLLNTWSTTSMQIEGFSGCCNPSHVAVTRDGNLVTSEKGLVRIKLYALSGKFLSVVATPEQFDEDTTGLDLAVDSRDRILALDNKRGAIRIFERKTSPAAGE